MFRGKLYGFVKHRWVVTPQMSGSIHWHTKGEQIAQLDQMGIVRLVRVVVPYAEQKKLPEASIVNMKRWSQDHFLPRLLV